MSILSIGGGNQEPAIRRALEINGAEHNHALIIPTACSTPSAYDRKVSAISSLFETIGVSASVLHKYGEIPSVDQTVSSFGEAESLYTIGGNTPYLMGVLGVTQIGQSIETAIHEGKPHMGTSVGASLPFEFMHSNPSANSTAEQWDYTIFKGLAIARGLAVVHANAVEATVEGRRKDSRLVDALGRMNAEHNIGLAIDNGAAVLLGKTPAVVKTVDAAKVHILRFDAEGQAQANEVEDPAQLAVFFDPK